MANFTPIDSLVGGGLIGLAAVLLMLLNGRIAGVSGIAGGLFSGTLAETGWRLAFVAGLVASPFVYALFAGGMPQISLQVSTPLMIAGGLVVGFGSALGGGCTSGHGICGIARLSPRSIAATLTFMATGIATVFVMRHVLGA
jgi:uncharacterized protein